MLLFLSLSLSPLLFLVQNVDELYFDKERKGRKIVQRLNPRNDGSGITYVRSYKCDRYASPSRSMNTHINVHTDGTASATHSVLLCNLFYVRFKRRLETTTRYEEETPISSSVCVYHRLPLLEIYGKEIVAIIFAKYPGKYSKTCWTWKRKKIRDEERNIQIQKKNNKSEERVFALFRSTEKKS